MAFAGPGTAQGQDFHVVTFGDSFASGEGAPVHDGNYGPTGDRLGNLRSDRPLADPQADWNGNSTDQAFTGDGPNTARRCHRSPKATSPVAVRTLQTRFPDIGFRFRSFACSGARIDVGVLSEYKGAEPENTSDPVLSQISQANSYIGGLSAASKPIDALVMNIGGNNLAFGNLIQRCENIGPEFPFNPCNPRSYGGNGNDDALRAFEFGESSGAPASVMGLDNLPGLMTQLDAKIDRTASSGNLAVKPAHVFLTGPPNPLAGPNGCTTLTGGNDYEKNLQASEIAWLLGDVLPRMVTAMSAAASAGGWNFVDMSARTPNGMCSGSSRMFHRNRDALVTQGATVISEVGIAVSHGIAHPNRSGYAAMAPALADALAAKVIAKFTPASPPSATPVPLLTLGSRVQMRLPTAAEAYPTRPAARVGTQTLAGPAGTGEGTIEIPVNTAGNPDQVSVEVRRCGPLSPGAAPPQGCSPVRSIPGVLVGAPGVPTQVIANPDSGGVRVTWTKGSPPERTLRRFVVRAENQAAQLQRGFSFGAGIRQAVLPLEPGDWRIDVLECTDRGCGTPSAGVEVHSDGGVQMRAREADRPAQFEQPVGIFSIPAGRSARAGRDFELELSWGTWGHWRDLRDVTIRLIGERDDLGTITVRLRSGRVTLRAPGSRVRRGKVGRRGILTSGRLALRTGGASITGAGKRSRLVHLVLPLRLSKRLKNQRVDVEVAASTTKGQRQGFGPAGSIQVRR